MGLHASNSDGEYLADSSSSHWEMEPPRDSIIRTLLDFVFPCGFVDRDSSNQRGKRPGFYFLLNDVFIFRGEENVPGADLCLVRGELSEEMIWLYGKVPYVLGYAASGYQLNFIALFHDTSDWANVKSFTVGCFNLEHAS
ncbi:hypothetical protein JG687_00018075 [Phytophthora cactorum]|uniref:Uncharacterized protein n=1 Tax=Phytophthora cactorum TaxID=29920 RepID=A0A8T1TQR3_9STRA|nr:hypothetical protein GQ600_484 [Phytophthora cactorum]KAG6944062.1 hypothetical protein JG687_00018075 [Phytophthora cactorum]